MVSGESPDDSWQSVSPKIAKLVTRRGYASSDNQWPDGNLSYKLTIKPSRVHRCLLLLVALMAALAILVCDLPALLQLLAWTTTGAWTAHQWRKLHKHWQLQHHGSDESTVNLWTLQSDKGGYIEGKLLQQGYRSAGLLVIVIGTDTGRRVALPVWNDSVSSTQFSYLNLQLMFNTHSRI